MSHEGTPAPTGQEPAVERRDILREQFDAAEAAQVEQKAAAAPAPEARADTQGRARDANGKFASKAQPAEAAPVAAAPQSTPAEAPPWHQPPKSWKKELREGWTRLDPTYQQYVHEREEQMHKGIEPLLPKAELADAISQVAAPYMATIQGLGLDLPRAVGGLMDIDHKLRTLPYEQKVQLLHQTALSYGVDLSPQLHRAQPSYDPYVQNQQNELLQLKGQFSNFIQQQEAQLQRAALEEIQRFSKTAEHFDEVKPLMAKLLQSGFAAGIDDAYDQAVRLTPEIFDAVQSARQAQTDQEKRKAADDAAKRARAAAVSVKTGTPASKTPTNAQDRRSVIREQLESLSERL